MSSKRFLFLLILLHGLFYIMALFFGGTKIADSYDYLYQAENLRETGSFYAWSLDEPIKPDYHTKRTPAYALFLYLTHSLEWLMLLLQNAMSVFLWWLVFRVVKSFGVKESKASWLILGVLLFQSNTLIYANSILAETPFQLSLFLGFFFLYRNLLTYQNWNWLLACLFFTLALLLKPVLLFFWLPLLLYAVIRAFQTRRIQIIWPVFLLPLTVLLWSSHNQRITGWAHFTSISTVNLKDYNTRLMLESELGLDSADKIISGINAQADTFSNYQARNRFIQDTCKTLLAENKLAYAKVHLKGMIAMLFDPGRYDYVQFFKMETGEDGLMYKLARGDFRGMWQTVRTQHSLIVFCFFMNLLGSLVLLFMAAYGLRRLNKQTTLVLLLLGIIGYFWVLTGPVGTARYKSAILPFLVLLAGLGISTFSNRKTKI